MVGLGKNKPKGYAKTRPTAPGITEKLMDRMKYVATNVEGSNSFNRTALIPMIAFGIQIASDYRLSKKFILGILIHYAGLYGDVGVQVFLQKRPTWIEDAITLCAEAFFDAE